MREKTYWAILEEFIFFIFKKSLQPRLRAVVAVFMAVVTFLAAVSVFRKKHLYRCRGIDCRSTFNLVDQGRGKSVEMVQKGRSQPI